MTLQTVNIPLARKVLEHIEAHPEEFDMDQWGIKYANGHERILSWLPKQDMVTCNTSACLAGWACHLDPEVAKINYTRPDEAGISVMSTVVLKDGTHREVEDHAMTVLGNEISFYSTEAAAIQDLKDLIAKAEAAQGKS